MTDRETFNALRRISKEEAKEKVKFAKRSLFISAYGYSSKSINKILKGTGWQHYYRNGMAHLRKKDNFDD
jgi:hypothetical protein